MPYEIPAMAGKPYRPSNGTEGLAFMESFCWRCKHDDGVSQYNEPGACGILGRSHTYDIGDERYPDEWTHDDRGRPTCTAFEEEEG